MVPNVIEISMQTYQRMVWQTIRNFLFFHGSFPDDTIIITMRRVPSALALFPVKITKRKGKGVVLKISGYNYLLIGLKREKWDPHAEVLT